jgi:hypothetical protein
MIGYHYTTWTAWHDIQRDGLKLSPLEKRHHKAFWFILEFVEDGCIWLYKKFQSDNKLIGMLLYVAARHRCSHLVCLEVEYESWEAAANLANLAALARGDEDRRFLTHNLELHEPDGPFDHWGEGVELLVSEVPAERIRLVGEWDLLDFVRGGVIQSTVLAEVA